MSEPDYFYYDPAEWQGGEPDWEIDDWYPEYDEDYEDDVSYEEYINNGTLEWDENDEGWPYPDEDDNEEAPF